MEHVLASSIMQHGDRQDILFPLQYGFQQKKSCELQLLGLVSDLHNNLDQGRQTDVLVMDFSKAFDKSWSSKTPSKTRVLYGVRGRNLQWISNFLLHRRQQVVLDGHQSSPIEVESGVPQGSVLGPCLFLYYINDLPDKLSSSVRLFADDAIIYLTIENHRHAQQLQDDLDKLGEWASKWMMELNTKKCQVITISRKRNKIHHQYCLNNTPLTAVNSTKYLGITITSDLKWNQHTSNIIMPESQQYSCLPTSEPAH